jgi:amino acid adenylation domain-containing protein
MQTKDNIQDIYSLTPLQEGLFFHSLADKHSSAYFIQTAYRLNGSVQPGFVQQSLQILFQRYDILRTSFVFEGLKRLFQVVLKERQPDFYFEDISQVEDKEAFLNDFRHRDRMRSFELDKDALMRVSLFRLGEDVFEFVWSHHHIIMDGWCTGILIREFSEIYNSLCESRPYQLAPVNQYREFIKWMESRDKLSAAKFWNNYLEGYDEMAQLPVPGLKGDKGYNNQEFLLTLPENLTASLQKMGADCQVTLNTILQSVWGILLSWYTNKQDVVFGTVVSIRPAEIAGVESMIGLFINTLPVRIKINPSQSFTDLIQVSQQLALEAESYQYSPLADIQAGSLLKTQLLDHVFVLGNYPVAEQVAGIGKEMQASQSGPRVEISNITSHEQVSYNFSINISADKEIKLRFNYNAEVYDGAYMERLARHFYLIAEQVVQNSSRPVGQLQLLTMTETLDLLKAGNGRVEKYDGTIDSIFAARAAATPDAIAIISQEGQLTYRQLNERSTMLAVALQNMGVEAGNYVGVLAGRSADTVISLLAIHKAGAVYVALDPSHPTERVRHIIADTGIGVLLTTSSYVFDIDYFDGKIFALDLQMDSLTATGEQPRGSQRKDTAYMIYTSGTTGLPKGVPIRQESITDRILYHNDYLGISESDKVLQFASVSFDASLVEMLMALLGGGILVIPEDRVKQDVDAMQSLIAAAGVTTAIFPPAYLKIMNRHPLPGLKRIISTGEAAILEDVLWYAREKDVYNGYGPTEVCVGATFHQIDAALANEYRSTGSIPIGQPFYNTSVFVLDQQLRLMPAGIAGEICVAGIGLSEGYLNQEEATRTKFMANPYSTGDNDRWLYRTGDIGRWNVNNQLEYLGRRDEQVQIRGIRVELSEIEQAICRHSKVKEAAVQVWQDNAHTQLVAYLVQADDISTDELRKFLKAFLPEYMIPGHVMIVESLPLTAGGKTDRKQLPKPVFGESASNFTAPVSDTEKALCRIWEEVLGYSPVGLNDNFFEIGGHSLKATLVISYIYREMNVRIDIGQVFDSPTVALLAPVVEAAGESNFVAISPAAEAADYPVSPSQRRLWVLSQFEGGNAAYNINGIYRLEGKVNVLALEAAFNEVVKRHESLRTVFTLVNNELRQVIQPFSEGFITMQTCTATDDPAVLNAIIEQDKEEPFNLAEGPLMRTRLVELSEGKYLLICMMHHIISDGWSVMQFMREVTYIYNSLLNKSIPLMTALPVQYKDYAVWLTDELSGSFFSEARKYWMQQFSQGVPVLDLPTDFARPSLQTYNGAVTGFKVENNELKSMRAFAQKEGVSVFMVLLTAVKLFLQRYSAQESVVVGTAVAGREHDDLKDQIGCYVNTIVLKTDINENDTLKELLAKVRQVLTHGYRYQVYPFDQLVDEVPVERDLSRSALFDVLVSYQKMELDASVQMDGISIKQYDNGEDHMGSKVDLEFEFMEQDEVLLGQLIYNTDLFKPATINQWITHFCRILDVLVDTPNITVNRLSLNTAEDEKNLLALSCGIQKNYPVDKGFVTLFEQQVAATPDLVAVSDGKESWTYTELNNWANRFARHLQTKCEAEKETAVGIYMERGIRFIGTLLAIWKAGAVYVPIDIQLPPDRVNYMLTDAAIKIVVSSKYTPLNKEGIIEVHAEENTHSEYAADNLPFKVSGSDLAYILYTSGSTGYPKGVMIEHAGMVNHIYAKIDDLGLNSSSKVAQTASQSFDISIWQMVAPLLAGGQVRVFTQEEVLAVDGLLNALSNESITILEVVPTYLAEMLELLEAQMIATSFPALTYLLATGEELKRNLVERWFNRLPMVKMVNAYGPTEASDDITHGIFTEAITAPRVPLGAPLQNLNIYVVDKKGRLCAPGMVGEIWVSGIGVGRGYIGLPEKTAAVFKEDPFCPGRKLYCTGDLGRWNSEGSLEFFGRSDYQVKIRGHRVELGEIERTISEAEGVKQSLVAYYPDTQGGYLTAYIVWKEDSGDGSDRLRAWLKEQLPDYMIPAFITSLETFPISASGKIDRSRLPKPNIKESRKVYTAPNSEMEKTLCELWEEVLNRDSVGITDNFFEIGGHSIKGIRLISMIEQSINIRLTLRDIFQYPDIQSQARVLEAIKWMHDGKMVTTDEDVENIII